MWRQLHDVRSDAEFRKADICNQRTIVCWTACKTQYTKSFWCIMSRVTCSSEMTNHNPTGFSCLGDWWLNVFLWPPCVAWQIYLHFLVDVAKALINSSVPAHRIKKHPTANKSGIISSPELISYSQTGFGHLGSEMPQSSLMEFLIAKKLPQPICQKWCILGLKWPKKPTL